VDAVFICSSPRTGSGVLCSDLWSTGVGGRPDEYLSPGTRREYETAWECAGDDAYAEHVVAYATTSNGVFSMKVHAQDLGWSRRRPWTRRAAVAKLRPYVTAASRAHFFWLRRRDRVRQAVSIYLARETGRYRHLRDQPTLPIPSVPFSASKIRDSLELIDRWDATWDRYFATVGVAPTRLWYEDDIERNHAETATAVLEAIGVDPPSGALAVSDYQKQGDDVSEAFVQRFRAEERRAGRG